MRMMMTRMPSAYAMLSTRTAISTFFMVLAFLFVYIGESCGWRLAALSAVSR